MIKRVALITGGTKGIGLQIAKDMSHNGYQVNVCSSNSKNIIKAKKYFSENNFDIRVHKCDVTKVEDLKKIVNDIYIEFNSLDILINNSGINETFDIEDISIETWKRVIEVNLTGTFNAVISALDHLKKGNHPRIINISSISGRMGGEVSGIAYSSSKGGIISLTYALAKKLAKNKITVNCIAPGPISSEMTLEYNENVTNKIPLNRFGNAREISEAVLYFCSTNSDFTTGAVLDINGGMFMG